MKLDATDLRYITSDEFRLLTAVQSASLIIKTISHRHHIGRNGFQKSRSGPHCADSTNFRLKKWRSKQDYGIACQSQSGRKSAKFQVWVIVIRSTSNTAQDGGQTTGTDWHTVDTIILLCEHCRSGIRCTRSEIRSVLAKNLVSLLLIFVLRIVKLKDFLEIFTS